MRTLSVSIAKFIGWTVVVGCAGAAVLVGVFFAYMRWSFHLPSDAKAMAVFAARKTALEHLVQEVVHDPHIQHVDAHYIALGPAAHDPAHIACAKRLRELGAQSLTHNGGFVQIYFWGNGCAICHDSFEGFAYVADASRDMPVVSKICSSLADSALPRGKYAPVEDGCYLLPVADHWYIIRWEIG